MGAKGKQAHQRLSLQSTIKEARACGQQYAMWVMKCNCRPVPDYVFAPKAHKWQWHEHAFKSEGDSSGTRCCESGGRYNFADLLTLRFSISSLETLGLLFVRRWASDPPRRLCQDWTCTRLVQFSGTSTLRLREHQGREWKRGDPHRETAGHSLFSPTSNSQSFQWEKKMPPLIHIRIEIFPKLGH